MTVFWFELTDLLAQGGLTMLVIENPIHYKPLSSMYQAVSAYKMKLQTEVFHLQHLRISLSYRLDSGAGVSIST